MAEEIEDEMIVEEIEEEPEPINDEGELLNDQAMDPDEWDLDEFEAITGYSLIVNFFMIKVYLKLTKKNLLRKHQKRRNSKLKIFQNTKCQLVRFM